MQLHDSSCVWPNFLRAFSASHVQDEGPDLDHTDSSVILRIFCPQNVQLTSDLFGQENIENVSMMNMPIHSYKLSDNEIEHIEQYHWRYFVRVGNTVLLKVTYCETTHLVASNLSLLIHLSLQYHATPMAYLPDSKAVWF